MELLLFYVVIFGFGGFFLYVTIGILVDKIIEPAYAMVTNKPLYVHVYVFRKAIPKSKKEQLASYLFYSRLSPKHQAYFEHRMACFLKKYKFYGKEGVEITPEMEVKIASIYIMLTFGMRNFLPSVFDKIVVYPAAFYSSFNGKYHKGEFNPRMKAVVFSWEDFEKGCSDASDNLNLGIHEFGHLLHHHGKRSFDVSSSIFCDMYDEILAELSKPMGMERLKEKEYFRDYAYENEFEFLAVILEHFFETPKEFQQHFPMLFKKVSIMLNYKQIA